MLGALMAAMVPGADVFDADFYKEWAESAHKEWADSAPFGYGPMYDMDPTANGLGSWVCTLCAQVRALEQKTGMLENQLRSTSDRLFQEIKSLRLRLDPQCSDSPALPDSEVCPLQELHEGSGVSTEKIPGLESVQSLSMLESTTPKGDDTTNSHVVNNVKCRQIGQHVYQCAEWRIAHFARKFQEMGGKQLVSEPIEMWGFKELRMLLCDESTNVWKRRRDEKCLKAGLKLKLPDCQSLEFLFEVGGARTTLLGPFVHNFGDSIVSEACEPVNFMEMLEADQSLRVAVLVKGCKGFEGFEEAEQSRPPIERAPGAGRTLPDPYSEGLAEVATRDEVQEPQELPEVFMPLHIGLPPGLFRFASGSEESQPEGINICPLEMNGEAYHAVEWRIQHLQKRLKESLGNALVSPNFTVGDIVDLRLMVSADLKDADLRRRNKDSYHKKVNEGPLDAILKLKADCSHELDYYFTVGSGEATQVRGPFKHSFKKSTITGQADLGINLIAMIEPDRSLVAGVRILARPVL